MRVREAAEKLEVSEGTVYLLVASGKLRCHRIGLKGGRIRISDEHLAEFLAGTESVVAREPVAPTPRRLPKLKHLSWD